MMGGCFMCMYNLGVSMCMKRHTFVDLTFSLLTCRNDVKWWKSYSKNSGIFRHSYHTFLFFWGFSFNDKAKMFIKICELSTKSPAWKNKSAKQHFLQHLNTTKTSKWKKLGRAFIYMCINKFCTNFLFFFAENRNWISYVAGLQYTINNAFANISSQYF